MSSNPELFGDDKPAVTGTYRHGIHEEDKILPLFSKKNTSTRKIFKGSSRAWYRYRKRIIRRMAQLMIVILIIYIMFMIYKLYFFKKDPFCTSQSCQLTETELLKSTDFDVNPCTNFYKFACGNWGKYNQILPYFSETSVVQIAQQEIIKKISQFLSQTDSKWEPKVVHEIRKFYQSCMKTGLSTSFSKEYIDFGELVQVLKDVHLPLDQHIMNTSPRFSWYKTVALSKTLFDRNFFFEFDIVKNPKNPTFNMILISKPMTTPMFSSLTDVDVSSVLPRRKPYSFADPVKDFRKVSEMLDIADVKELSRNAYHRYIRSVYKLAYDASNRHWSIHTEKEFNMMFVLLMLFSSNLDQTLKSYPNDERHLPKLYTIDSLQKKTDAIFKHNKHPLSINWKEFLKIMFEGTNVTLDFESKDKTILISHTSYLISVLELISKTPPFIIESYLWWETVHGTLPFINCKMNEFTEEFSHSINKLQNKPRELFCAEMTNNLYGFATAYFLANDKSLKQKTTKIKQISDNIQSAFSNIISNLDWLDNSTKNKALRKLFSVTKHVGYPKWMESTYNLDKYYENTTCSDENFLRNVMDLKRQQMKWKLILYRLRNNNLELNEGWYSKYVLQTNAFYVMEKNSMVIPAGLFRFPFFDLGLEALNYGSIGMIIGHEMTHGFDNIGKEFDEFGRLNKWWSKKTEVEFEERAKCFIQQYDSYNRGVIHLKNGLNGSVTLNENIADNGGIQLAYYGYKNYIKKYGNESLLPRLKYFTPDQLFFLSFAHTWCEHRPKERPHQVDEPHSPYAIRVSASLKNFPEFSKAWGCKKGTPMNPEKLSCQLW